MISTAAASRIRPGLPPWKSALLKAAELLAAVPRGQLDMEVLITLHSLLVPATNPYRGCVRDSPAVIWLDGVVRQELPAAHKARTMVAESLRALEAAVASGVANVNPIVTATEIVFQLLQAHPFMDGNGRVARAVGNWVLQGGGYCVIGDPQSYCRERKAAYYEALAIMQGVPPHSCDPGPWKVFFAALVADCYQVTNHGACSSSCSNPGETGG